MSHLKHSRRDQHGLATLEVALILPLLVTLLFGIVEFGWLFLKNQQIAGVARTACRYGITALSETELMKERVETLMKQANLDDTDYKITGTSCEVPTGEFVTLTITVPYAKLKLTGFPLPLPDSLVGTITMAKEGPPFLAEFP